ncbi:MAG: hypothetical protein VCB42_08630 [Myxococcota bacterium]
MTTANTNPPEGAPARRVAPLWQVLLPWLITAGCFAYLYTRLDSAAARDGQTLVAYLSGIFSQVNWGLWLALMIPYSAFFFVIDSAVVWAVINWYNTKVHYRDILPIRGSSYILSILNEQVGKGAMGVYLYRRDKVPGWEVGSSMLFIMFCEFYYLLIWATVGYLIAGDRLPEEFSLIPYLAIVAGIFFAAFHLFFSGNAGKNRSWRDRPVFHAFRNAKLWHYGTIMILRSPALLAAVVVYTLALRLFGVPVEFSTMLGYLPVIFFGAATPGPMRSVAITLWVVLFPGHEGQMTTFGFVQHNFFIFFNAAIGLLFLRRARRDLFGTGKEKEAAAS